MGLLSKAKLAYTMRYKSTVLVCRRPRQGDLPGYRTTSPRTHRAGGSTCGLDTEQTLKTSWSIAAGTSDEQMRLMVHICALLADQDQVPFDILSIIISLVTSRGDFRGQQKLNKHMKQLSNMLKSLILWC